MLLDLLPRNFLLGLVTLTDARFAALLSLVQSAIDQAPATLTALAALVVALRAHHRASAAREEAQQARAQSDKAREEVRVSFARAIVSPSEAADTPVEKQAPRQEGGC